MHPDLLIVILKTQIEVSNHADIARLPDATVRLQDLLDKCWNLLDELIKVHGRTPFIIISFDFVIILIKLIAALVDRRVDLTISTKLADGLALLCNYVVQQISTVCQSGRAELNKKSMKQVMVESTYCRSRHDDRRLERVLITQENVKVEALNRFIKEL